MSQIDWTVYELQKHIEEIVTARKLVTIYLEDAKDPLFILFKYPDRKLLISADVEYEKIMHRAKMDKFKTEEEMMAFMQEKGIWTQEDDDSVNQIREKIEQWSEKLTNEDISNKAKGYARQLISKYEMDVEKIEIKKERMLMNTAERKARQAKYDFLLWMSCLDPYNGELMWDNYLTFLQFVGIDLKNKLLTDFLKYLGGHDTSEIRYIARSNLWRINYVSSTKANMPLLPLSVIELTPDQLNLIWWSGYYQSVNELMPEDQPEDYIIEDDELLDKHMADLHKERNKDYQTKRSEKKYGTRTAMKMPEVLVFGSHPDYERMEYDQIAPSANEGQTSKDLKDDPRMKGAQRKKSRAISKSRRYRPDDNTT